MTYRIQMNPREVIDDNVEGLTESRGCEEYYFMGETD